MNPMDEQMTHVQYETLILIWIKPFMITNNKVLNVKLPDVLDLYDWFFCRKVLCNAKPKTLSVFKKTDDDPPPVNHT